MSKKLVVLGLDGASWKLLDRLIDDGKMPTMEMLKKNSSWGDLKSTIPPLTPTAWTSMQTGVNPGKHGVFTFHGQKEGRLSTVRADDIKSPTFQEIMENRGLKAVLVNLPLSHPPKTNFPTIGSLFSNKKYYPESLGERYDFSEYELSFYEERKATDREANLKAVYSNLKNNFPTVKELYQREEWDIFFYLFSHTDWAQHQGGEFFWEDGESRKAQLVKKIFSLVDEKVKWFVDNMDDETNLLMMSDHGFKYYEHQISPGRRLLQEELVRVDEKTLNWNTSNSIKENLTRNMFDIALKSKSLAKFLEYRYPWYCHKSKEVIEEESEILWGAQKFPSFFINDGRFYGVVEDRERTMEILKEVLDE